MARDGYRIFDSDTHVGPDARILAGYLSEAEKDRLRGWEAYKSRDRSGHQTYTKGQRSYRRRLGTAKPDDAPSGYMVGFTGVKRTREPSPLVDADPGERIKDMDHEGVDVNLTLPSGWFGTWTAGDDVTLEMAMYRAYHRWMADYCGSYPNRLGGVILAGARDIDAALVEIRRWGQASWAWGMMVYAPVGTPLDHPALEPLYAEAAELDLAVVLHTFTVMPPLCAGRAGHLGQFVAPALGGSSLVRHAQHGGDDRQRCDGPLPQPARGDAGGGSWMAPILDGAAR